MLTQITGAPVERVFTDWSPKWYGANTTPWGIRVPTLALSLTSPAADLTVRWSPSLTPRLLASSRPSSTYPSGHTSIGPSPKRDRVPQWFSALPVSRANFPGSAATADPVTGTYRGVPATA